MADYCYITVVCLQFIDEVFHKKCKSSIGFENVKAKDDYVLSYNRRLRLANWVAEVMFWLMKLHSVIAIIHASSGDLINTCFSINRS